MIFDNPPNKTNIAFLSSSSALSSSFTSSTASSGSTVPGPGSLTGKAILALGKATLRSAEYVLIRRRLNVIASKFPLADSDASNVRGIEQMYDDLLELSRLEMYSDTIRDRALRILLVQIGIRQTRHMIKSLKKWPDIEIQLFLTEFLLLLDSIRLSQRDAKDEATIKAYQGAIAAWESHSIAPFIDFCERLARSPEYSTILLRAGILDFLLHLYVNHLRDPLAETDRGNIHRVSTLQVECNFLLAALCATQSNLSMIRDHPLHALWPTRPELPFTINGADRIQQRISAWNVVSREVILRRLYSTFSVMLDPTRTFADFLLYDACVDLLELSGDERMDIEIGIRALRSLHQVFTHAFRAAQHAIKRYLELSTVKHSVKIIAQIVRRLSRIIEPITPEAKLFFSRWDHKDLVINAIPHFLHLFINLAKADDTFLTIFLAADVLGLMRPFLEMELSGSSEIQIAHHGPDLFTVYDPPDFALLALIKERGLKDLLPELPPQEKSLHARVYRRNILRRAFNVFLGRGDLQHLFPEFWNFEWEDLPRELEGSEYPALWAPPLI
ncbi:hypothetical protein D9615_000767 [Tricholomella constricta]|uniref:Uncharacterized protein n=1 Tax=Tricholomella constricta TaxID=117010 RepID=A0A8H5HRU0_9AGAR|nr:hypothetical protein D9615_000767 [Tricholomella constricta]